MGDGIAVWGLFSGLLEIPDEVDEGEDEEVIIPPDGGRGLQSPL